MLGSAPPSERGAEEDEDQAAADDEVAGLPMMAVVAASFAVALIASVGIVLYALRMPDEGDEDDEDDELLASEGGRRRRRRRARGASTCKGSRSRSLRTASFDRGSEDEESAQEGGGGTNRSPLADESESEVEREAEANRCNGRATAKATPTRSGPGGARPKKEGRMLVAKFAWDGQRGEVMLPPDLDNPLSVQAFVKDLARRGTDLLHISIKPSAMRVEYKVSDRSTGTKRRVQLTPNSQMSELRRAAGFVVTPYD